MRIKRTRLYGMPGDKMLAVARAFVYETEIQPVPDRWRFYYRLGASAQTALTFVSVPEYPAVDAAVATAKTFASGGADWLVTPAGEPLQLKMKGGVACTVYQETGAGPGNVSGKPDDIRARGAIVG